MKALIDKIKNISLYSIFGILIGILFISIIIANRADSQFFGWIAIGSGIILGLLILYGFIRGCINMWNDRSKPQ